MPRKQKKNIIHVYTTTKVEQDKAMWRLFNFFVLLAMAVIENILDVGFPETGYLLVIGAILGVDIPALVRRFLKKV